MDLETYRYFETEIKPLLNVIIQGLINAGHLKVEEKKEA